MTGPPGVTSAVVAGRYTIEREIGRGATATVYCAQDSVRGLQVAVKVLRQELADSAAWKRFLREVRFTSGLQHPRILPVLDAGEWEGQLYCVLPYMDGGTLRHRLRREKQLPLVEAVRIARIMAEALHHAHAHGLIHRDVKPENILFTGGEPVLADFGIARALERVLDETSTSRAMIRGTPAYMSPEQASGEQDYDGRSDVFSLGCVLYEMLAGVAAFFGPTAEAVLAMRFVHPPRELEVYRPSVPAALEAIVTRSLQIAPADRFSSAGEMAEALRAIEPSVGSGELPRVSRDTRPHASRARGVWARVFVAIGIAALVGVGAKIGVGEGGGEASGTAASDTTRIAVLPLEARGSVESPELHDDLLHDALSRWRGIELVDQFRVAEAAKRQASIATHEEASRLATALGAGRYVRGVLQLDGDSLRVSAGLFDVDDRRSLHTVRATIAHDARGAAKAYAHLARAILLRGAAPDPSIGDDGAPRSVPALQAFGRAQRALDEWDLAAADSALEAAVGYDEAYGRASFWLAQVRVWRELPATSWHALAVRSRAASPPLAERERRLADALVLLGDGHYARACAVYDELRRRNDSDFAAWFGLGRCRTMDRVVLRDSASPSGWRFRSSYHSAMEAYTRAFEVLPTVHHGYERGAFEKLRVLLLLTNDLVTGRGLPDSAVFHARPGLRGDTLVLVPYPFAVISAGGPNAVPPGFPDALERQRARFRQIASTWSAAFPRSARAKYAVALALDLSGDPSSIDTLRVARRLESDALRHLELAVAEVMLLVKMGVPRDTTALHAAGVLADSLLAGSHASRAAATLLAPVAMLRGRCDEAERLGRAAASQGWMRIPGTLFAEADALLARHALGCRPSPGLLSLDHLREAIRREYPGADAAELSRAEIVLLFRPLLLATTLDSTAIDEVGDGSSHDLLRAARAYVRHDTASARSILLAFESQWSDAAGPVTPDIAVPGARLWVMLGDTAKALQWLERSLGGVRRYDFNVLTDLAQPAALVRAMQLRADLTAQRRPDEARLWGRAVAMLWSSADADLHADVRRMTRYFTR